MPRENIVDQPISKRQRTTARIFSHEHELKAQLRKRINQVEPGLTLVDDGKERAVATGRIDVTARDKDGDYLVIELKVGACPHGALEQVLGYADDLSLETDRRCRALLVASEFSPRLYAAARRAIDVRLLTYQVEQIDLEEAIPRVP
jgi:RecB family endonuclease NucS